MVGDAFGIACTGLQVMAGDGLDAMSVACRAVGGTCRVGHDAAARQTCGWGTGPPIHKATDATLGDLQRLGAWCPWGGHFWVLCAPVCLNVITLNGVYRGQVVF